MSQEGKGLSAPPLGREHMPPTYGISMDSYIGRVGFGHGYVEGEKRIPEDFGPPQSMKGFESTYRNIIDYIVRITYRIWEDRDVGYIGETYSGDSKVYDDYGLQLGNQKIISDTHHTTGAFSNIRLIADDVIWAGNDEIGYHTSHRTIIRGTNDGDSKYGPATGRDVDVLVIANCVALENKIFLEHVLYNNSSMLMQLGLELNDMAKRMVDAAPAGWPRTEGTWKALRAATSPRVPISVASPVEGFDPDAFSRRNMDDLWNNRNMGVLHDAYAPGFQFNGASGRAITGADEYSEMMAEMIRCFPDLKLQVDEVYWMGNETDGYLVSTRWSADATHARDGSYGEASGAPVQIWGISQNTIRGGKIIHEWMLFNELDLMMQIAAARKK